MPDAPVTGDLLPIVRRSDLTGTARLVFAAELARGALRAADLERPEVAGPVGAALAGRPSTVRAAGQRLRMKAGAPAPVAAWAEVREAVLGPLAAGPPRALVRVDEFPHAAAYDRPGYGTEAYRRFHAILAGAGVPYLVAVVSRPAHAYLRPRARGDRPLDAGEVAVLRELAAAGVEAGVHGLTHRSRARLPQRRSELSGRTDADLAGLLDACDAVVAAATGARPRVVVPPFNRFDPAQYGVLAARYRVVCGGPEMVRLWGMRPSPSWLGGAVYLPSYPPLYAPAATAAEALQDLERRGAAVWAPVVLHWGEECDDGFRGLRRAAPVLARYAEPWAALLAAVADPGEGG